MFYMFDVEIVVGLMIFVEYDFKKVYSCLFSVVFEFNYIFVIIYFEYIKCIGFK